MMRRVFGDMTHCEPAERCESAGVIAGDFPLPVGQTESSESSPGRNDRNTRARRCAVVPRSTRSWTALVLAFLGLWLASTAALATVYNFSSTFPSCSWAGLELGWWPSGTTYTCYGTVSLGSGDSIAPTSSITIVADLTTTSGDITVSNTTIKGDLTSNSGAINLTNVAVTGSVSTKGTVTLSGGSVSGDVTGRNGVTTTNGTTIGGSVDAATGDVNLSGGSVTGSVSSGNAVTTTNTDVGNGVSSTSSTVSITGGTIRGSISTKGGSGIIIKDATVTVSSISAGSNSIKISGSTVTVSGAISGGGADGVVISSSTVSASSIAAGTNPVTISSSTVSGAISGGGSSGVVITDSTIPGGSITATDAPIKISDSTIGSSSSLVNISGNNTDSLLDHTTVYGDVTAGSWTAALSIDTTSQVYGTCTPENARCSSALPCNPPSNTPSGLSLTCVCDSFPTSGANGLKSSSIFNSDWLISTSDSTGILPRVVNKGYLRLTDNTGNNAKAATVPGIFPAAGNYISVEFKHYAYSSTTKDNGDGIAVTLSDYSVPAVPGGYGGSLGYAQMTGIHDGFAGGWIGIGLDEYGYYQNPIEGRLGGDGRTKQSVAVRGSGSGQSGYNWLAGTASLSPLIDNSTSTTPSRGYSYQVIVDARNEPTQTAVTVNRNTGSGYTALVSIPNVYAKATANGFTQSAVPLNWQISFTGSTGGATNIHEIGGLRICAQTVLPTSGGVAQIFSAIDEAYGTPSQTVHLDVQNYLTGHIYTKLVGTPFKLNVAALDNSQLVTTYAASADTKVTVKLVDNSDALTDTSKDCSLSCTATCKAKAAVSGGTQTLTFTKGAKDKGQKQSADFTINSAYQKLVAVISDGTTSACSIDSFAVRPLSIASLASSKADASKSGAIVKAGRPFDLTATTAGVAGYASLYTGIMKIDNTLLEPAGGATVKGAVAPEQFPAATSGTPSSTATGSFSYSEVGKVLVPALGVYDDSWTVVDSAATKSDCVAGSYANTKSNGKYGCNFGLASPMTLGRFIPDHFVVTNALFKQACDAGGYSYMAQPFTLSATVEARNADDIVTQNYSGDLAKGVVGVQLENNNNGTAIAETRLAGRGSPVWSAGSYPFVATSFSRLATPDGSYEALDIGLSVTDPDALSSIPGPYLMVRDMDASTTACTTDLTGLSTASAVCTATKIVSGAKLRFGRLRLSNAFGSDRRDLSVPVEAQYWSGLSWVRNAADSCTTLPVAAIKLSGAQGSTQVSSPVTLSSGSGNVVVSCPYATCPLASKPATSLAGSVGVCVDLGVDPTPGVVCSATSAALPYLQGKWPPGTTYANDPSARATFGVYSPETRKTVHIRELY